MAPREVREMHAQSSHISSAPVLRSQLSICLLRGVLGRLRQLRQLRLDLLAVLGHALAVAVEVVLRRLRHPRLALRPDVVLAQVEVPLDHVLVVSARGNGGREASARRERTKHDSTRVSKELAGAGWHWRALPLRAVARRGGRVRIVAREWRSGRVPTRWVGGGCGASTVHERD